MIIRLIILLLMASSAIAGDLLENWPPGQTEKMSYEIRTFKPRETVSYRYIEITRSKTDSAIFTIKHTMELPDQDITIISLEKYRGEDFYFLESDNYFLFPESAKEKFGTDSLHIRAIRKGDSLKIKASGSPGVTGVISFPEGTTSNIGSLLLSRNMDFKVGNFNDINYVNIIKLSGQIPEIAKVRDSVIDVIEVFTPAGTFECYKVKNIVPETHGYTFYDKNNRHVMVKTEIVYAKNDNPYMTHTLTGYEVIND